jgi:hypothetical protein
MIDVTLVFFEQTNQRLPDSNVVGTYQFGSDRRYD